MRPRFGAARRRQRTRSIAIYERAPSRSEYDFGLGRWKWKRNLCKISSFLPIQSPACALSFSRSAATRCELVRAAPDRWRKIPLAARCFSLPLLLRSVLYAYGRARALPVRLGLTTRSYAPSSFICRLIATSDAQLRARVACRTRAHDQSVELVVRHCFSRLTQHRLHRTQPMFCGSRALVSLRLRLRLCCESVRSRTSLVDTSTHTLEIQ